MIERGTVLERHADGQVVVEVDRGSACDGCHAKGACSMGFGQKKARVTARDETGAEVGQRVTLELGDGAFLTACVWVYLVPLVGLFAGAGLAWWLFGALGMPGARDAGAALASLAGTAAGLGVVWMYDRRVRGARGGPTGRFEVRVRAGAGE